LRVHTVFIVVNSRNLNTTPSLVLFVNSTNSVDESQFGDSYLGLNPFP